MQLVSQNYVPQAFSFSASAKVGVFVKQGMNIDEL